MRFTGEFDFLSNFYPAEVWLDGWLFPTVEHAYQAAKTMELSERLIIRDAETPGRAKRAGRKVTIRPDWETVKLDVMRRLLFSKFSPPEMRFRLIAVEGEIVEENNWGDTFWGRCDGVGENHLGKILMELREIFSR